MTIPTEKPAPAAHPIHELLVRRWSPLAFSERPVEGEKLLSLLEAARWSPSCFGAQPWNYLVAKREDEAEFARMLECLAGANAEWASKAPVLMIGVARLNFEANGKPNRWAQYDLGQSAAHLTFQATAMGLWVHQMGGFDVEKVRKEYGVPEGFEPMAAIAVGYAGDPEALPEKLKQRQAAPRARKRPEEFVFSGAWGRAAEAARG